MPAPADPVDREEVRCPVCQDPLPAVGAACERCLFTMDDGEDLADSASVPATAAEPFTGPKNIADYRILREIGAGGMGTVFEAHETKMDRRVALKVLSRHQAPSEKADKRFAREAWIAGKLSHPNIVKVYERGTWEELSYYSMEIIGGGSLSDVIGNMQRWGRDERLGLEFGSTEYVHWAIKMIIATARGLDYAHRQGVVHRDIKPMNLLLCRETATVKIADFGLAFDQAASRMTTAGKVMGTLVYMAPEQILGRQQEIDQRTDVFALGVTLFELLTLVHPYSGESQQLYMNSVLTGVARRPSKINEKVSGDLETVIRKALEKDRKDRYASAAAFAEDLENVLQFRPIGARAPSSVQRLIKWVRRKPLHAALLAMLIVGLPGFVFLSDRALRLRRLAQTQNIEQLWERIRWLDQRDRVAELLEPLAEILRLDPEHVPALQTRAVSYMSLAEHAGNTTEAADLQGRSIEDADQLIRLNADASWPYRMKASILTRFGREKEAAEADALAATNRPSVPSYNDFYFDAKTAMATGDYREAADLFTEAMALRPGNPDLAWLRARAYEGQSKLQEASQDYRIAIAMNPGDVASQYDLGRTLTRAGALDEGATHLRAVQRLQPDNALVHEALAENLLRAARKAVDAGDSDAALSLLEEGEREARSSLEMNPDLPWSHVNLGLILGDRNRQLEAPDPDRAADAIAHFESALVIARTLSGSMAADVRRRSLVSICDALIETRDLDRALPACREVTVTAPDDAVGFYNMAGVYALLGRTEDAYAALERNFELGDRDWRYLERDRWFETMRTDAHFRDLLNRMKGN